ncbi:MAG: cellulosome protein dockerin type I [Firmicutes bacterium]|nr:cellulosome protein dockerin type I [Bacillota bacterium]
MARIKIWQKIAAVGVLAAALTSGPMVFGQTASGVAPAVGKVEWSVLRQPIVGFGGSGAFGQAAALESMPAPVRTHILNLLFSTKDGIGLTVLRSLVNDGNGAEGNGLTIEPAPGQWDWNILPDAQIWLMQEAMKYGVKTLMSTPWSPPAWMKANDSVEGGPGETNNVLLPKYYHAYAVYLANYVNGYWTHFHIRITDISVQNEPDQNQTYASCVWTPEQLKTFIQNDLGPVFQAYHVKAKVIMPEQSFWGEQYAVPTLEDPKAARYVQIIAAHGYGGTIEPLTLAEKEHKQVWETEDSTFTPDNPSIEDGVQWADTINQYLTVADVSVWNYWWLVDEQTSDNEGLINILGPTQYVVNKRLYTLGNFSRFIRPGYHRILSTINPAPGIAMSAYKNAQGTFAVVVINSTRTPQPFELTGLPDATRLVTPYVTSATQNLAKVSPISVEQGAFRTTLPAMSVTTFVGHA